MYWRHWRYIIQIMDSKNYFSCLLRVWHTQDDDPTDKAMIQVEEFPSGEMFYFSELAAFNDFLKKHLLDMEVQPGNH